jgi:hypothetical protein
MEFLKDNNLLLLIYFVAPGFISLKVWGLLNSAPQVRLSENLTEAIIYSAFNALPFAGLYSILYGLHPVLAYIVIFLVFPVLWPLLFYLLSRIRPIKTRLTPSAWDHYFNRHTACFVLLRFKNGGLAGGFYGNRSFASSYPEKENLYMEEQWVLDEEGSFIEKKRNTDGFLVSFSEIESIELFQVDGTPLKKAFVRTP